MTKGGKTFAYSYGADGVRTQKTVDGVTTEYYTVGGKLLAEKTGDRVLTFHYDEKGTPYALELNGTRYYYRYNLQGDVIGLYSTTGAVVAEYTYDPWGKLLNITDTSDTNIGALNPLRYRGYYYDTETGFYFLQSRYYDPTVGRFINADGYVSTGQGISSYNMFAYCLNDPVNMQDASGEIAITTLILIGSVVAGCLAAAHTAVTSYKYIGEVDISNTILSGLSAFMFCYTMGMSAYGLYLSYCDYRGYTPVTNIGQPKPKPQPTPYSNLKDPENVGPGKDFTATQKNQILQQNRANNNGVVKSDQSGRVLIQPQKSTKGVTPSPYEWQIDHIVPKSAGGTNSFSNAQVLSREENRIKWDR